MVLLSGLLLLLGRSAGRILNTLFGWAIVLFFGQGPERRQVYLSVMAFGSIAWLFVALGIPFPEMGVLLLTFVPVPTWIERGWVRLGMLAATVVLPAVIGFISLQVAGAAAAAVHPLPRRITRSVLVGVPFTLGVAMALILMTLFAPFLRLRLLLRRWTTQHTPVTLPAGRYEAQVLQIETALRERGWPVRNGPASWMLRLPAGVLTALAGGAVQNLVARRPLELRWPAGELVVHPADLVVNGREPEVTQIHAALAEALVTTEIYLTWSDEGRRIEDRIRDSGSAGGLSEIEEDLRHTSLAYAEWEVLFRKLLLRQRAAQTGTAPHSQD